ncbi:MULTISPECIES: hypothetical protein [unclassified Kitasatospora]|uniref:hypothetical protein n=1 Tax=unclassified Kitasatospora TaxID=2633591 RepID=UPI00070DDA11|nr:MULTISPECIES: hypothetical protein [unclassified Kitasatospora]KQV20864.1 hypothetical protein ASC99_20360 [Kitasatospora sp. Root107]KRB60481.1 hypothetical protein ASE03_12820 [Kitasatospora sp. Root187]
MSGLLGGADDARDLAVSVQHAFEQPDKGTEFELSGFVDVAGLVRRLRHREREVVAKLRCTEAALSEQRLAAEAARRLDDLSVAGFGAIQVCVPELVQLPDQRAALVSPYLGIPLSAPSAAALGLSGGAVSELLATLLARGVEASGCIPRNMFCHSGRTVLIDWEDALLVTAGAAPDQLTLMKWDIAWSDLFGDDLRLSDQIPASVPGGAAELDGFEATLAAWLPPATTRQEVRRHGIEVTLASELPVSEAAPASAARLGHLAEDVLPPQLGVFHTVLTARLRERHGDAAYAALLGQLHALVKHPRPTVPELEELRRGWVVELFSAAEDDLLGEAQTLRQLVWHLDQLVSTSGWAGACERAEVTEEITSRLARVVLATLGHEELDLLLRGSCAQGVLGLCSDVDFELSSAEFPAGYQPAEELLIEALGCLGLAAEGSAARPVERDLVSADGRVSRDLHEWFELRRPGSAHHDPGWTAALLSGPSADELCRPSQYEEQGRELTAKYLWFESRAALTRLAFTAPGLFPRPVTLERQLTALPGLIGDREAAELRDLVHETFTLREAADPSRLVGGQAERECSRLAERLDRLRQRLGLPGPQPS